jgi:hypothetical protein
MKLQFVYPKRIKQVNRVILHDIPPRPMCLQNRKENSEHQLRINKQTNHLSTILIAVSIPQEQQILLSIFAQSFFSCFAKLFLPMYQNILCCDSVLPSTSSRSITHTPTRFTARYWRQFTIHCLV